MNDRLKPGGILYISYNVMPGWSPAVPLRHLLNEFAKRAGVGGIVGRVNQSIDFVEQVISANAGYFRANPDLAHRLELIKSQNRHYLSHEYFNEHWRPESFSEIHDTFAQAKMSFGASANIIENLEGISIPIEAVGLLNRIEDNVLRETTKDYFANQQFRRDIFVKGVRKLTHAEVSDEIQDLGFIMIGNPLHPPLSIRTPEGEAELLPSVYEPIVNILKNIGHVAFSLREMQNHKKCMNLSEWQIWEALLILVGTGFIAPLAQSQTAAEDATASLLLNLEICRRSRYSEIMQFLAARIIGSAISISRIEQLILLGMSNSKEEVVSYVLEILKAQGEKLFVDGATSETDEQNYSQLEKIVDCFEKEKLLILKAVGAVKY